MMEMTAESVPSVKNPRLEDMDDINRIVNEEKDKTSNSGFLLQKERRKRAGGKWRRRKLGFVIFRERESAFSLRSRAIGPSDFFVARRKVALRGEDYACSGGSRNSERGGGGEFANKLLLFFL